MTWARQRLPSPSTVEVCSGAPSASPSPWPHVPRERRAGVVRRRARRLPVRRRLHGLRRDLPVRRCGSAGHRRPCSTAAAGTHSGSGWWRNLGALPGLVATHLLGQGFIRRRSRARWLAHQLVFWGCILAALVTFPLDARPAALRERRSRRRPLSGVRLPRRYDGFDAESVVGWVTYHALDVAAVLVLGGVFIFLRRRLRDPGALATERSGDFLALAGLFAVSVTGLFLTVSSTWLDGQFYAALNTLHALTVILGLMYIPFGKLFHIFQRPAISASPTTSGPTPTARRPTAGVAARAFASAQQIADLKAVLPQVGFDYYDGRRRQLPGRLPALPAGAGDAGPVRPGRRFRLMARHRSPRRNSSPGSARTSTRRRPAGGTTGSDDRPCRRDPLLLLRPAVRDQAEGPRQRRRRLRTVVRVPLQRGQALPEGREALSPGQPPGSPAEPARARPGGARGFRPDRLGRSPRPGRGRDPAHPGGLRRRRLRHAVGCLADQREELPDRQVRPPRPAHRQPRLQRPVLHGVGRRRQQEGAGRRPQRQPVE